MRADYALSHLYDGEICRAITAEGERKVRWDKKDWHFYYVDTPVPQVCDFDEIREWRIAAIKQFTSQHT
ncbi:hypothetical protein EDC30_104310 [Paucimonas lemoignei]|uniref:Uncharacterized protein n=1 Tax=Paucimonas lemoignei TaxID=29443 RepID=A0A4R3HW54_PAULE|nr:hypothetical protein [Paucimonas lemoignei]TCS37506.1 hypothetical protein EDC30_104310 [Paucimonas lemoignei]